ncbi:MAG: DUF4258 domain-containing protein [Chloroflexi bacterium]|nr:DUF4258 domain-containing protein [Chloroflexota bacterium]
MSQDLLEQIRHRVARRQYAFTIHGVRQAEERNITPKQVEDAVLHEKAEIIEDYPDNPRGPSCLILGWTGDSRPLHVHVTYPPVVLVITVYEPGEDRWADLRTRRRT